MVSTTIAQPKSREDTGTKSKLEGFFPSFGKAFFFSFLPEAQTFSSRIYKNINMDPVAI